MANLVLAPTGRLLTDVERYLDGFLGDPTETGTAYLDYVPTSSGDELVPENVAVSTLMNSSADARTFLSIRDRAREVNDELAALPKDVALDNSTPDIRAAVVSLVSAVGQWPGIMIGAISVTTRPQDLAVSDPLPRPTSALLDQSQRIGARYASGTLRLCEERRVPCAFPL